MFFDKLKAYGWMAVAIAAGIALVTVSVRSYNLKQDMQQRIDTITTSRDDNLSLVNQLRLAHANEVARLLKDNAMQAAQYRNLEKKYADDMESSRKETTLAIHNAKQRVIAAESAARGVSSTLAEFLNAERDRAIAAFSAITGVTEPAALARERDTVTKVHSMLTELYRSADEQAGIYASIADEAYLRGKGCERGYEIIRSQRLARVQSD